MACKLAVKFILKQEPETKAPHFYKLVTTVIVINVVIGRFIEEDLK